MSGFDVDSLVCGVTATIEDLRTTLGIRDRVAFWGMTMGEARAASERMAWCAAGHGGHRAATCVVCRDLVKKEEASK